MNKEQYLKMRIDLTNEAESLITDGKLEEAEAKMNEIKDLDNKWEETKKAQANLNALKGNEAPINLADKSVNVNGATKVDDVSTAPQNQDESHSCIT